MDQQPAVLNRDWPQLASLWLVLDQPASQPFGLAATARKALDAGVDAILFRHKTEPFGTVLYEARTVRELCREQRIPFVLSHELAAIAELAPDAVQLGAATAPPELSALRAAYPAVPCWGVSTHSLDEALRRAGQGYDYCFLGPVFDTPSKRGLGEPLGAGILQQPEYRHAPLPIVLIGGLDSTTIPPLLEHGAKRFAVIRAIQDGHDPAAAARKLRELIPPLS